MCELIIFCLFLSQKSLRNIHVEEYLRRLPWCKDNPLPLKLTNQSLNFDRKPYPPPPQQKLYYIWITKLTFTFQFIHISSYLFSSHVPIFHGARVIPEDCLIQTKYMEYMYIIFSRKEKVTEAASQYRWAQQRYSSIMLTFLTLFGSAVAF